MSGTFNREEYERVQQADDAETGAHPIHWYLHLAKKLLWLTIGALTLLRTGLPLHIFAFRSNHLCSDPFFYLLSASVIISSCLMVYLVGVVKRKHGPMALRRWRTFAPRAVQTLTGANVVAFVAAVKTFYPIYGHWTLPMVVVLSWAWLNLLTFV